MASQTLETNEFGLTCAYGFDLTTGRLSLIGGGFYETIDYSQARNFTGYGFGVTGDSTVELTSNALGYRLGIGYEIPEYALKAQLLFRSATNHDASGSYSNTPFAVLAALTGGNPGAYGGATSAPATASATLPAIVDLTVQSGIAEGWLAFGSIKWTDWSVLEDIQVVEGIAGQPFSTTRFFFEDGWTLTGGVGHRLPRHLGLDVADLGQGCQHRLGHVDRHVDDRRRTRLRRVQQHSDPRRWCRHLLHRGNKVPGARPNPMLPPLDYTATSSAEWGYAFSVSASARF